MRDYARVINFCVITIIIIIIINLSKNRDNNFQVQGQIFTQVHLRRLRVGERCGEVTHQYSPTDR